MLAELKPLAPYLRRYRGAYAWGALVTVLSNAVWIFFPLVLRSAVNDLSHGVTRAKLLHYAAILVALAVVKGFFLFWTRWIVIGISRDIEFNLRNDLFATLERQPAAYFQRNRTGDIMARMTNDLNAVRMLLGPAIMYSANTILFTLGALYFLLRISPMLTLVALAPLPLASVLVQMLGRKIHDRFERIQAMFSDISAQAQENFSGARLVRAFAQEQPQIDAFEQSNREYIRRGLRLVQLMGMLWPTLEFLLGLAMVVMLTWPIIALGWVVNLLQRGKASVVRIQELLEEKPTIDDRDADPVLTGIERGAIEFRGLHFRYESASREVLHGINLRVPAGGSLALVGPTGAGKSTLASLLVRMHDAPDGTVLIDGRSVRAYPLDALHKDIGYVPQETFLFSTTIRDNITLGRPEASEADLLASAEAAHIRREFEEFPAGFETVIGERGLTLSGGQKQRSALARALIRDPRILILDDALASVDTYTEEQILNGLSRAMAGRTTILIAHRVSTIRSADQIAVLLEGRVAELGTHEELVQRGGYYASLYEKQMLEEEIAVVG